MEVQGEVVAQAAAAAAAAMPEQISQLSSAFASRPIYIALAHHETFGKSEHLHGGYKHWSFSGGFVDWLLVYVYLVSSCIATGDI